MRLGLRAAAAAALLLAIVPGRAAGSADDRVTPGEVLVVLREIPGVTGAAAATGVVEDLARAAGLRGRVRSLSPGPAGARILLLRYEGDLDPALVAARLSREAAVRVAAPNRVIPVPEPVARSAAPAGTALQGDPLLEQQRALDDARVPGAWAASTGAGVIIAVVDTGIELDHPDLVDRLYVNFAERDGEPGVDDDGNGYVDDVTGYDFTDVVGFQSVGDDRDRDPDPSDDLGHGTQVAGIAVATRNNGVGIAGVAPDAVVMPLRAGFRTRLPFASGLLQEDDAAAAILYAADNGADILNLSFGDDVEFPVLREAVRYAVERGVLVVGSAGNDGFDRPRFPAAHPGVLVAGASSDTRRATFSSFGETLDLIAPGTSVLTTDLGGGYGRVSGTSFSAPITAGAAALVMARHPTWSPSRVAWALRLTARGADTGWNRDRGWGRLDATAAVAAVEPVPEISLDAVRPRTDDDGYDVFGTVVHPALERWTLTATPDSADATPLTVDAGGQRVAEPLNATPFRPAPGVTHVTVTATVEGLPPLTDRLYVQTSPEVLPVDALAVEAQAVSGTGWDAVVTWSSPVPYQGSALVGPPGSDLRRAEEPRLGRNHVVRVTGPLAAGANDVIAYGRSTAGPTRFLEQTRLTVPPLPRDLAARPVGEGRAGTPMVRATDFDADGRPEAVYESLPQGLYGRVVYDETVFGTDGAEDLPTDLRGIPVAAGDGDGDGLQELIVFRLDLWTVFEQRAPGEFPILPVFDRTGELPCGFVDTPDGPRLMSVRDGAVRLYRGEGSTYALDGEFPATGIAEPLRAAFVLADFDGDGRDEVAFTNAAGQLVTFRLVPGGLEWVSVDEGPAPLGGPLAVLPDGPRPVLLAVEHDPDSPEVEGDFARAAVRVRAWDRDGTGWSPGAAVAFAGLAVDPHQLVHVRDGLLLRRETTVDRIVLEDGVPRWEGTVLVDAEADGMAVVENTGAVRILLGAAEDRPSTLWRLGDDGDLVTPSLRATRVRPVEGDPDSVSLTMTWDPPACADDTLRVSDDTGILVERYVPERPATLILPIGEEFAFTLTGSCRAEETVRLTPRLPVWPDLGYGVDRLEVEFARPVEVTPDTRVLVEVDGTLRDAEFTLHDRSGRRLLVTWGPAADPPTVLHLIELRDSGGMPVGGADRGIYPLFPGSWPDPDRPVVVRSVEYAATVAEGAFLDVVLSEPPRCDPAGPAFALEPLGWALAATDPAGGRLGLPEPLPAGTYTLRLLRECGGTGPGAERSFTLGRRVYPNPVRGGAMLVVEGASGAAVTLVDATGQTRWTVAGAGAREEVPTADLAPGLYILVIRAPGEDPARHRVAVVR